MCAPFLVWIETGDNKESDFNGILCTCFIDGEVRVEGKRDKKIRVHIQKEHKYQMFMCEDKYNIHPVQKVTGQEETIKHFGKRFLI